MSGSASIRGFVYQTIISVINSFEQQEWDFCQVEPEIGNEKADIIYWKDGQIQQAIQVKSSQNSFNATKVKDWLEKLSKNLPESLYSQLILIGNCESNLMDYIKRIDKGEEFPDRKIGTVSVRLIPFDQDYLSSTLENKLRKFFELQGYPIQQQQIEMLTSSILYSFLEFSITSEKVSREDFSGILINWAKAIFPKSIRRLGDSELRVYLYDETSAELKENQASMNLMIDSFQHIIDQCNQQITENYEICKLIRITIPSVGEPNLRFGITQVSALMESVSTSVTFKDEMREQLKIYIKQEFGEEVEDHFFEVGNLRKYGSLFTDNLIGTENQKAKYYALGRLYWAFHRRHEALYFKNTIEQRSAVSLVLKNEGKGFDEEIEVMLEISKDTDLLQKTDFPFIESRILLKQILDKKILERLLEIKSNHLINEYPFDARQFAILPAIKGIGPFSDDDKADFEHNMTIYKKYIQGYMDYKYDVHNGKQYLKFEFPKLNPNQIVAFPCRLFLFKSEGEIKISYTIRSKHSSDATVHSLLIHSETNHFSEDL